MSRDWCFTCFDTDEELNFEKDNIKYICYGVERCPTTDREHYQGYAIFNRTCRIPKAKQWIGGGTGTHCEPRRGTRDQARDYCRKSDGRFFEWGQYESITEKDLFKKEIGFLKREYPAFYCRYYKGLERLQDKGDKWRELTVTWLHGAPGTGKTKEAMMSSESVFKLDRPYKWFDGYEGEDVLVLDDVDKLDFRENRGLFLNLLDGYQLRLDIKGSFTYAKWTKVYITSNWAPECIMCQGEWSRRVSCVRATGNTIL